jgi:CSLREA domain-containing protein
MKSLRILTIPGLMIITLVTTTGLRQLTPLAPLGATLNVDIFTDEYNNTDTGCSMREAITAANTDADFGGCVGTGEYGADTINLPSGRYLLTRLGSEEYNNVSGDLNLHSDLVITVEGSAIIDAGGDTGILDRVMVIGPYTVTLTNLTITGGRLPARPNESPGASGGGINSVASLTLINVTVDDNRAGDGSGGGQGGGIFSSGLLTLQNSVISNNRAGDGLGTGTNGALGGDGGGIFAMAGSLTITDSSIINNTAGAAEVGKPDGMGGKGGGICNFSDTSTITGSTISGNQAGASTTADGGQGGGIYNGGNLTLVNTTISGNTSGSTTSVESHASGKGGGISVGDNVEIYYSTIYDNHAGAGAYHGYGGGLFSEGSGYVTISATILAGNTGGDGLGMDCYSPGSVNSGDYNLIGNTVGCEFNPVSDHSILNPEGFSLPPLGNYGGLTRTHPLPTGNLAIDQIPPGSAACGESVFMDQRGYNRPVNGDGVATSACDIGAYERQWLSYLPLQKK